MDRRSVIAMVESRSPFITATPERQHEVREGINAILNDLFRDRRSIIEYPYTAHVYRSIRP